MKVFNILAFITFCSYALYTQAQTQTWNIGGNTVQQSFGQTGNAEGSGTGQDAVTWKLGIISAGTVTNGNLSISHYNTDRIYIRPTSMSLGNTVYTNPSLHINYSSNNQTVGVGTSSPQAKLHVAGTFRADGNVSLQSGLTVTGYVGIGTSNPSANLHVAGSAKINGALNLLDNSTGIALNVNNREALWIDANNKMSWGYGASANYFNKGIAVGYPSTSLPTPPSGGMLINGDLGIGINTSPLQKLHIKGGLCMENANGNGSITKIYTETNNQNGGDALHIDFNPTNPAQASMLIGYYHPIKEVTIGNLQHSNPTDLKVMGDIYGYGQLQVCGKITTTEVQVKSSWCDYVYDKQYPLMSIDKLEEYINTNKHLPNIPSATEVEKDGLNMADMQRRMMEKIEELSLYVIQLKKQNESLAKEVETLGRK